MGKVTVYCGISGCSPDMHRSEWFDRLFNDVPEEGDVKIGPIVRAALLSLIGDREKRSQDDVTLIGPPISKDDPESRLPGLEELDEGFNAARLSAITNESLLLYRCTVVDDDWGYGVVSSPERDNGGHCVSLGPIVMVQTSALSILLHATFGRMSARRFWRLMMVTIRTTATPSEYVIPGINYGALMHENDVWDQFPRGTICMESEEVANLEPLGDEEQVRQTILNQGHYWVWLSPDCFPLQPNSRIDSCPILIEAASSSLSSAHKLSSIEHVPQELLVFISSQLPLPTFLSLASASRHLRYKLLGTDSDRNAFARSWMTNHANWYVPLPLHPSLKGAWKKSDYREQEDEEFTPPKSDVAAMDWDYLRRCLASGSMRNRKRIWNVAEQLEKKADELGI
ncbi:hypothetical protein FIBSPDRAFT_773942 [Athelia psychrophila]|uniref:F-box domain-containing protein n=1 Tax=Athelia psychrophila TaxID=1759441 RepID=A0A166VIA7_9AGAM|nr:hypothetical protein FIBSPDRAFT_773942 [Fibularhizoctonia sp. CBS 109695]